MEDIGETVKIIFRKDALSILKSIRDNTFPPILTDFFINDYETALKGIRIYPKTYNVLSKQLKRNQHIKNVTRQAIRNKRNNKKSIYNKGEKCNVRR